jgi:hypothetical protein
MSANSIGNLEQVGLGVWGRGVGGFGLVDHGVEGGVGVGGGCGGAMGGGVVAEIVGRVQREDAFVAFDEEEPFEEAAALVVEEIFVPATFGEFWNDDEDAAIGLLSGELKNVLNDWNDDEAVWRWETDELWRRVAGGFEWLDDETIPFFVEDFGVLVGFDVNGDDFGGEARGKFEAVAGDLAVVIDGDDGDRFFGVTRGNDGDGAARNCGDGMIVAAYRGEDDDQHRDEKDGDPCAFDELCDEDHEDGDAGDEAAESIDECVFKPVGTAIFTPMLDHAELREREGEKRADGVERNEAIGDAAEKYEQRGGEQREDDDAVGVDEPAAAERENVWEIIVVRDRAAEARKIGERGVGGERENEKDRGDGEVVEISAAENGGDEEREQALVAGLARVGGGDAVSSCEIGNSCQKNGENHDDDGERALGIFHGGFAERFDAVTDGFDAGESGATAGESFEQEPDRDGLCGGGRRRQRREWRRMSAGSDDVIDANGDGGGQCADEKIGGEHEGEAGFAQAAEIEDGDDNENADAESDGVRLKTRNGGDERADSGGDTDGRGENVVGEQSGGGKQAGQRAEIVARDRVGAAAVGISGNGLAIRKINDDEQDDDRGAERANVVEAGESEGDEQAESGFGAVRGGAESVEPEDGDAAAGADLLGALFAGGERLADEEVEDVHEGRGFMCGCVLWLRAIAMRCCRALLPCASRSCSALPCCDSAVTTL